MHVDGSLFITKCVILVLMAVIVRHVLLRGLIPGQLH